MSDYPPPQTPFAALHREVENQMAAFRPGPREQIGRSAVGIVRDTQNVHWSFARRSESVGFYTLFGISEFSEVAIVI
ncbi:hypothetical protein DPEC_G00150580 [Dallia pectoralis]|uniref:Uncharacterized protein n=1 Tax=Dallia pectoralis TaxID=75939 RepID=A0ACC2GJM2_DALPE|nr:hypothetical protein DPEC_G00150580 [Dallia pectoralis]